ERLAVLRHARPAAAPDQQAHDLRRGHRPGEPAGRGPDRQGVHRTAGRPARPGRYQQRGDLPRLSAAAAPWTYPSGQPAPYAGRQDSQTAADRSEPDDEGSAMTA